MSKRKIIKNSGITLIALVITIIVLLILSGVSIATLTGENGILIQAQNAKEETTEAKNQENEIIDNYENTIEELANGAITAKTIANSENKNEYYGKVVTNYFVDASVSDSDIQWKIFYAGTIGDRTENNIYLIASDYVKYINLPKGRTTDGIITENQLTQGSNLYNANWNDNLLNIYNTGSERITDPKIKALNNDYFNVKHYYSNNNMKAVAYMLDTKAWENYANTEYAEYAIGGPPTEMLMKSYSQKLRVTGNEEYKAQANSDIGYQASEDGGATWYDGFSAKLSTSESLYVIPNTKNGNATAKGYWLSSPSAFNDSYVARVYYNGYVNNSWSSADNGFRPLVCLKANIKLKKVENGYEIY